MSSHDAARDHVEWTAAADDRERWPSVVTVGQPEGTWVEVPWTP
jgi:hypothetical protein